MRCLMIGGDVRGRPGMSRGRHDVPGGRSKECGVGPDRGPRLGADASNRVGRTCSHTLSTTAVTHQHQHHQILPENIKLKPGSCLNLSNTRDWCCCQQKFKSKQCILGLFCPQYASLQLTSHYPTSSHRQDRPQPIDFSEGGPSASLPVLSNLLTQESHTVFHTLSPKSSHCPQCPQCPTLYFTQCPTSSISPCRRHTASLPRSLFSVRVRVRVLFSVRALLGSDWRKSAQEAPPYHMLASKLTY